MFLFYSGLVHLQEINATVWMMAGTSKKQKYIPFNEISLQLPHNCHPSILAFHALTGSDTTSFLFGHSKKTSWDVFKAHFVMLTGIGEGALSEQKLQEAEKFTCKISNLI